VDRLTDMMTETQHNLALHEQVLVEFDLDGRTVGLRAVVVNVLPAAIWLGLTKPDSALERLSADQRLNLTFRLNGAALIAASRFVRHLGSSRSRLFAVGWPDGLQTVQRRGTIRMDAECPVQYGILDGSDTAVELTTGGGMTRNISAVGVLFATQFGEEGRLEVGNVLELRIALGSGAVITECEVVRVEEERLPPGAKPRPGPPRPPTFLVAVKFDAISEMAQDRIVRHIFSLHRRRRSSRRY
jgi:hypothetical protein